VAKPVEIRDRDTHIVSTAPYMLGECLRDLLDLAARLLVLGGRLVFFFPTCES
jgi:tRNA (guanine10-N2)-methyltransferase